MTQKRKVEHLNRLHLAIEAGTSEENMDLTPDVISYELVTGIGPQGYSPLEFELLGKKKGDTLRLSIPRGEFNTFFEHLGIPLDLATAAADPVYVKIHIHEITIPDQTEIIRAMAGLSACGEHCCGGH